MLALAEEDQDRFFNWLQEGVDEAGSSHAAPPLKNSLEFRWGQFGKSLFAKRPFRNGGNCTTPIPEQKVHGQEAYNVRALETNRLGSLRGHAEIPTSNRTNPITHVPCVK